MSEHFFNVTRPVDVASDAITSTAYSSPEKDSVIPVYVGNNSYNVVAWGSDNQLPYKLSDMVERNSVLSQDKFFNVLTCYSRGIEYMDLATRGSKHPLPTADKNVKRFLMRNNMKRFFAEQITDLKYYFFCVSVVILSRDRSKIVRIVVAPYVGAWIETPCSMNMDVL